MKRSIVIFAITIALGVNVQVHGAMAATKTLYENTGTDTGDGLISSKWVGDDGIHGAADDFKVPKSRVWTITEVDATGVFYFDDGEAFFVDVYIFKNHGDLPGKLVASYPALPFIEARAVQDGRHVCYDKHSHAHFSIGAITGGHSHYLNQRSLQEVGPGSLVLMNPEEVHACNPIADQPWSYLMFYLDTGWLQRQQEEAGLGDAFRPFDMTASRDPQLYQGLCRLHRQLVAEPDPLAREVACHQF